MEDLTTEQMAEKLVKKFLDIDMMLKFTEDGGLYYAKKLATMCADICIEDAIKSMKICRENKFHLHAEGLMAGTIINWQEIKQHINKES